MNPFTPKPLALPRVSVPGVDAEEVEALQERFDAYTSTRRGYLLAMIFGQKPIYGGHARWKRPKKKTTAHVKRIRNARARSAFLAARSAQ